VPVVDASLIVAFVAPTADDHARARAVLEHWSATGAELAAPRLMWEETLNALRSGIRRGRWSGGDADAAASRLFTLPVTAVDGEQDRARGWELARRYDNWPVYDMIYVALAERLGEQFVTADDKLSRRLDHLGWVIGWTEAVPRA
jgi:predicted nucleic acid-binding protein